MKREKTDETVSAILRKLDVQDWDTSPDSNVRELVIAIVAGLREEPILGDNHIELKSILYDLSMIDLTKKEEAPQQLLEGSARLTSLSNRLLGHVYHN